ncbi:MAG: putative DNA-binding domain-containing protein [Woeseia sp.]
MAERPQFQRRQYEFAAHIRAPDGCPAPDDIEDRRMAIYRNLFFNNLYNLLSGSFPVLRKIHEAEKWRRLVRQFMTQHRARTPYFLEIPREFLSFLESGYTFQDDDFPFLLELAHYEWSELAVSTSEAKNDLDAVHSEGDLLDGIPVLSVLALPLSYTYPVHRITPDFKPVVPDAEPNCLVVFRRADDETAFMQLNAITARLLERIRNNNDAHSGRELLLQLAAEIQYPDSAALVAHGHQAMQEMRASGILLGTRKI